MFTSSGVRRSLQLAAVALLLVTLVVVAATAAADGKGTSNSGGLGVGYTTITGSPLTLFVAKDASYQVFHDGVDPGTPGQVYYTSEEEADSGLFLWYDGYAIGPDFDAHEFGSASNTYDVWSAVSQSAVLGSGTEQDPWIVETSVQHVASGATMDTATYYVNGEDFFRIQWEICVPSSASISTFIAADYYLEGSDNGYGYYDEATGSIGGYNQLQDWYQVFTPITPASAYFEGYYGDVWDNIGMAGVPGPGFDNTIVNALIDNGAGLQWDETVTGCESYATYWSFGETPITPPTSVALSEMVIENSSSLSILLLATLTIVVALGVTLKRRISSR